MLIRSKKFQKWSIWSLNPSWSLNTVKNRYFFFSPLQTYVSLFLSLLNKFDLISPQRYPWISLSHFVPIQETHNSSSLTVPLFLTTKTTLPFLSLKCIYPLVILSLSSVLRQETLGWSLFWVAIGGHLGLRTMGELWWWCRGG